MNFKTILIPKVILAKFLAKCALRVRKIVAFKNAQTFPWILSNSRCQAFKKIVKKKHFWSSQVLLSVPKFETFVVSPLKDWILTLGTKNEAKNPQKRGYGYIVKTSSSFSYGYKLTISLPDFVVLGVWQRNDTTHRFTSYQFCHRA